ncbi:MAG: tripartite tricarboxylate transporter substrate binding protein [Proteobacteria bacterium]|nr:tripartite tricarboxylate transporter substrate binding protein [Pseudomonadota bacterium]
MSAIRTVSNILSCVGFSVLLGTSVAIAQTFPEKPVWMVVPFPAGASTDASGRMISDALGKELGQPIIVENKSGAGGNIGADFVANKKGDPYYLLLGTTGNLAVNKWLTKDLGYDPLKDFTPLTTAFISCNVLVVPAQSSIKTLGDLIAEAKKNPGKLNYGSPGIGTAGHLAGEWFKKKANVNIVHVPYRGGPQVLQDLLAGLLQISFEAVGNALPQVKAGKLRPLASTCRDRIPMMPDVPTMIEAGIPDFDIRAWGMIVAPADIPKAAAEKLNAALVKAINSEKVRNALNVTGVVAETSSLEGAKTFLVEENRKWKALVESAGITPQ